MPVNPLRHFSSPKLGTLLPVLPRRKIMSVSTGSGAAGATDPTDPGTAFKLVLSCPSGLPASRVFVKFDPSYDRIPHPDVNLEESINEYGGHAIEYVDGSDQISSVCLHMGLTDYRTFVGTNLSPLWERFLVPSTVDSLVRQHTSSPLGNGAIVETSDGKILVLQRSYNVGEFPGYFVFPGGHSEPQEIGISAHLTDKGQTESELLNQKASMEMFDGIIREVVEEIGLPANSLVSLGSYIISGLTGWTYPNSSTLVVTCLICVQTDPLFIGISCRVVNVRPTAFFFLKCNLEAKEVCKLYSSAQDGYESTQIFTVQRDDLKRMAVKMPGCHRGGYALYKLMMEATKDS
ncbi:NUDIX domain [Musa troglodytarum]|uniref:NUDIX domain n=1 Tax=Musa troglodytarum TaxID=320322 RepID=A0A9E7IAL2_9LILI|nr:NUDIX domain [Musa troglodytarum]